MKYLLVFLIMSVFCQNAMSNFIYPENDEFIDKKLKVLTEIDAVMELGSPLTTIFNSGKIFLWANEAQVLPSYDENGKRIYKNVTEPSFTVITDSNNDQLYSEARRICNCEVDEERFSGILIAHPLVAAKMFQKRSWRNFKGNEVIGVAPPIVIIYHEMAHIRDYLLNADLFFLWVGDLNSRWKNGAEESASLAQNEFVRALSKMKSLKYALRDSYGRNELIKVDGIYSVK